MDDDLNSELLDMAADLLETVGDQLLDGDILRDIPILNIAIGVAKAAKSVSDRIFLSKVKRFLYSQSKLSDEDKVNFTDQMEKDEKLKKKIGEIVILLIDRSDDLEKVDILAKIFASYVKNKITFNQFHRISVAVDSAFIGDLKSFYSSKGENKDNCYPGLVHTGLVNTFSRGLVFGRSEFFEITEAGTLFVKILNDEL